MWAQRKIEKVKRSKEEKKQKMEDEVPPKKMNKDFIEQMDFVRPKSRRRMFPSPYKLEEKYNEVGDV